jgi:DNA-binding NtrC family response regulator
MSEPIVLIGNGPAIRNLREEIAHAARSDAKVLITGESGTGKEIAARLLHMQSARSHAPCVTLNCAGLPDTLLETELFGHVRGSFTGAFRDKPGLLEQGNRGTVVLDEVGEMSLRMQGVVLRFLETGEVQRVGATRFEARLDVRVIAATNRNLPEMIAAKTFREDLFYRLNVIHLTVPPLREHREDIPLLAAHFVSVMSKNYNVVPPTLTPEALGRLTAYSWPGNVRELRNVIERVLARLRGSVVNAHELPAEVFGGTSHAPAAIALVIMPADTLYESMIKGGESFWTAVYRPFMSRDLTRTDLQKIVGRGLEHTRGSYRGLVELFNMPPDDYKRFLNFLRKHHCHLPFQQFRSAMVRASEPASSASNVTPLRRVGA